MKVGKIILPLSFLLIIFSLGISTIFKQDNLISISERRNLETKPKVNKDDIISGKYFKNLESYLLDQISFREKFRTIKSLNELYIENLIIIILLLKMVMQLVLVILLVIKK